MRFIPTTIHGAMDYLGGLMLIVLPLLWMDDEGVPRAALAVPVGVGVLMVVQAFLTNYEWGVVKMIPVPMHLAIDGMVGLFLMASPWLFGFADYIWWPHVLLGVGEIVAALTTNHQPGSMPTHAGTNHRAV